MVRLTVMVFRSFLAVAALVLVSFQSQAALTLLSIGGVSRQDLTDPAKPIFYGGFAGTCNTPDGSSTCDSCINGTANPNTGNPAFWPCNKTNAYPTLKAVLRLQASSTAVVQGDVTVKKDSDTVNATVDVSSGVITVSIAWSEICARAGKTNCDPASTAADGFSVPITVAVAANSSTGVAAESMTFQVIGSIASTDSTTWSYTDCAGGTSTANQGFCHFSTFPGDEKIYVDLVVSSTKLATAFSGITYSNIVFFSATGDQSTPDATLLAGIKSSSGYNSLSTDTSSDPPTADNRITGLTNDQKTCLVMANQDNTGVISFYTPVGTTDPSTLCAVPSKVIGLLDDKSCFIATAAFGSDMAPEVQSFRDFRNKFLLTNSWGRAFVKFYYKHSPYYANLISESEVAKATVRGALWPLLFFARMSVAFGFWTTLLISSMATLSLMEIYRRLVLGRKFRGEL